MLVVLVLSNEYNKSCPEFENVYVYVFVYVYVHVITHTRLNKPLGVYRIA